MATQLGAPVCRRESGELDRHEWFVVQTKPRKEKTAFLNLEAQSFQAFLPMIDRSVNVRGRTKNVLVPLFSGYMFVCVEMARQRWRSINSTFGVTRLIGNGERPAKVPQAFITSLLKMAGENGEIKFRPELSAGDRVRFVGGVYEDWEGVVERADDMDRVSLLIDIVSRKVRVETSSKHLMVL